MKLEDPENTDAKGFTENQRAAEEGGQVAGNACEELEKKSGKKFRPRRIIRSRLKASGDCGIKVSVNHEWVVRSGEIVQELQRGEERA